MKNSKITMVILSGLFALAVQSQAQTVFQVNFKGTCWETNANGDIVSTKLSNQSFIQDAVAATGTTNKTKSLTLVYAQNASTDPNFPADFIEVVDSSGTVIYTNLQFMYSGHFPPALTNSDGSEIIIGAQVIPLPLAGGGDSLGGATITERVMSKKTVINGSFNYVSLRSPTNTFNDIVDICSGTFNVSKPFSPH